MLPGASLVWSVLRTRWPVNEALMAISAVSRSRISPTRMMFGSCLKSVRATVASLYKRRFFLESMKNRRSAKRKRDSAQPQEIDRRYNAFVTFLNSQCSTLSSCLHSDFYGLCLLCPPFR